MSRYELSKRPERDCCAASSARYAASSSCVIVQGEVVLPLFVFCATGTALSVTLRTVWAAIDGHASDEAAHCYARVLSGVEGAQGLAAFLDKRKPNWIE